MMQSRAPNKANPRRVSSRYLLSGLAKCETCGKAMPPPSPRAASTPTTARWQDTVRNAAAYVLLTNRPVTSQGLRRNKSQRLGEFVCDRIVTYGVVADRTTVPTNYQLRNIRAGWRLLDMGTARIAQVSLIARTPVNEFADLTEIEAGIRPANPEPIRPEELVEQASDDLLRGETATTAAPSTSGCVSAVSSSLASATRPFGTMSSPSPQVL